MRHILVGFLTDASCPDGRAGGSNRLMEEAGPAQ